MTYIEIKTLNGKQYKYLRKTVRNGKKMNHITLKYLGPVNPIYKIGKKRSRTNASVYVRTITDLEKGKLKAEAKSSNSFTKDRAKIILYSSQRLKKSKGSNQRFQ